MDVVLTAALFSLFGSLIGRAQPADVPLTSTFMDEPRLLPEDHAREASRKEAVQGVGGRARAVADYIANMTDRFAILEHGRLFDPRART